MIASLTSFERDLLRTLTRRVCILTLNQIASGWWPAIGFARRSQWFTVRARKNSRLCHAAILLPVGKASCATDASGHRYATAGVRQARPAEHVLL